MEIKKYSHLNALEAEMNFIEDYPFASSLLEFVKSVSGQNRWFLDECIENGANEYWVTFKSYADPEHQNFLLSIYVAYTDSGWNFSVHKQITE